MIFHGGQKISWTADAAVSEGKKAAESRPEEEVPRHFISRSWERFARIGSVVGSKHNTHNITHCESGETIPGLSAVDGMIFITNPRKLRKLESVLACVGEESVALEMVDGASCTDRAWCSEVETEEECRESCHTVTGGNSVGGIEAKPKLGQSVAYGLELNKISRTLYQLSIIKIQSNEIF